MIRRNPKAGTNHDHHQNNFQKIKTRRGLDCKSEFQDRGNEHLHAAIHVVDAPKIDIDEDEEVTEFIDKYITCSIPNESIYPVLNQLVKSVQTHKHRKTCEKTRVQGVDLKLPGHPLIKHLL